MRDKFFKVAGQSFLSLLPLLFLCESVSAEVFRGKLFRQNGDVYMTVLNKDSKKTYPFVLGDDEFEYTLDVVYTAGKNYFFEVEGKIQDQQIIA